MVRTITNIAIGLLRPSPLQQRTMRNKQEDAELKKSIEEKGILTPLIVRPLKDNYEVLDGHRRLECAGDLKELPCEVRNLSDDEAIELITIVGLQRENLHPLDQAQAYKRLRKNLTLQQIADRTGKTARYIAHTISLSNLIPEFMKAFKESKLRSEVAILLSREVHEIQHHILKAGYLRYDYDDEWIKRTIDQLHNDLSKVPWSLDDTKLLPEAGACSSCQKRTDNSEELFPELAKNLCLDHICFARKLDIMIDVSMKKLQKEGHSPVYLAAKESWNYATGSLPKKYLDNILHASSYRHPGGHYESLAEKWGVFIDGPNCGKPFKVLTKWKDKRSAGEISTNHTSQRQRKAENARRRLHDEVSNRIAVELLQKLPPAMTRTTWDIVLRSLIKDLGHDGQRRLCAALKLTARKGGYGGKDYQTPLFKELLNPKSYRPERVAVTLTAATDLVYGYSGSLRHLTPLAKLGKINVKQITASVRKAIAKKQASKKSVKSMKRKAA